MKKPILVVMAAGMGSRYGGLKQIDPVDEQGHIIMDFSVYDAVKAGFGKVVFVIRRENEADFREAIGDRVSRMIPVAYVYQDLDALPEGFAVPKGRVKPWGTGHAVLCCKDEIDGPFAVVNADDYYGAEAFALAGDFLRGLAQEDDVRDGADSPLRCMMVGYELQHTITENGHVSRGVCETDEDGFLRDIHERTHIEKRPEGIAYTEDDGKTWVPLAAETTVSMNMWGFPAAFMRQVEARFSAFLEKGLADNPQKCEYFLPFVVDELLREGKATVKVEKTAEQWYGVTYREDRPMVTAAVRKMKEEGKYPQNW